MYTLKSISHLIADKLLVRAFNVQPKVLYILKYLIRNYSNGGDLFNISPPL